MEALQLLASSGANADAPDYNGRTALHVAAAEGRKLSVYCLLSRCACRSPVIACTRPADPPFRLNEEERSQACPATGRSSAWCKYGHPVTLALCCLSVMQP